MKGNMRGGTLLYPDLWWWLHEFIHVLKLAELCTKRKNLVLLYDHFKDKNSFQVKTRKLKTLSPVPHP